MSTAITCPTCDDFGWVPEGQPPGWYGRDWRLLLDPTVSWRRCPDCGGGSSGNNVDHLQEYLAGVLLARLLKEVVGETTIGSWRYGHWHDCPAWVHGQQLVLVGAGNANPHPWLLASPLGVMQDLSTAACYHHLERAGLPRPPLHEAD